MCWRRRERTDPDPRTSPSNMITVRTHLAYLLIALLAAIGPGRAAAQGVTINWPPTTNLSNTPTHSNHPTVAADPAGNVHVVWSEDMARDTTNRRLVDSESADTLVYTRWDGSTWTAPIDIIAVPGDDVAEYAALAADAQGYLHLVWTGVSTLYYSRAPALQASSPHAWSAPVTLGSSARTTNESAVAVDAKGTVHILYANLEIDPAVMHVRIADNGLGSMTSTRLSESLKPPNEAVFAQVSLKIDPKGRLHALWLTAGAEGFGHAIYYARSLDAGQTWSKPIYLAQGERGKSGVDWPSLGIAGDSELHLVYPYPANMARTERISLDGGETWGEPHTIYKDLEGIAGFNAQITDAAGNLHVVSRLRTHEQVKGLFYWRWLGDRWSPWQIASLETEEDATDGHFPEATIRLGNEIHVVWHAWSADHHGEVLHASGVIPDVAALAPVPLPTIEAAAQRPAQPRPSPAVQAAKARPTVAAPESVSRGIGAVPGNRAARAPGNSSTLLVAMAPALLLVLGVVAWRLARKR